MLTLDTICIFCRSTYVLMKTLQHCLHQILILSCLTVISYRACRLRFSFLPDGCHILCLIFYTEWCVRNIFFFLIVDAPFTFSCILLIFLYHLLLKVRTDTIVWRFLCKKPRCPVHYLFDGKSLFWVCDSLYIHWLPAQRMLSLALSFIWLL